MYMSCICGGYIHISVYIYIYIQLCQKCQQQEETPYHLILQCSDRANEARQLLTETLSEEEIGQEDYITILNGSRHENFIKLCLEILSQGDYRDHIDLDRTV